MREDRVQQFRELYLVELERVVREYPEEYAYSIDTVPAVVDRMMEAIRKWTFNKDSRAIKATCKLLGVKHTYAAMRAWLTEGS